MGKLSFQMQTLEQTAEQEQKLKDAMKYATPDQLKETLFIFVPKNKFLQISAAYRFVYHLHKILDQNK